MCTVGAAHSEPNWRLLPLCIALALISNSALDLNHQQCISSEEKNKKERTQRLYPVIFAKYNFLQYYSFMYIIVIIVNSHLLTCSLCSLVNIFIIPSVRVSNCKGATKQMQNAIVVQGSAVAAEGQRH